VHAVHDRQGQEPGVKTDLYVAHISIKFHLSCSSGQLQKVLLQRLRRRVQADIKGTRKSASHRMDEAGSVQRSLSPWPVPQPLTIRCHGLAASCQRMQGRRSCSLRRGGRSPPWPAGGCQLPWQTADILGTDAPLPCRNSRGGVPLSTRPTACPAFHSGARFSRRTPPYGAPSIALLSRQRIRLGQQCYR